MEKNRQINEELLQYNEALGELKEEVEGGAAKRVAAWESALKAKRSEHKSALASAAEMMPGGATAAFANPLKSSPVTAAAFTSLETDLDYLINDLIKGELAMHEAVEVRQHMCGFIHS